MLVTLGQRLAELRKTKGMNQKDVAEVLGVSRSSVASWETGHRIPRIEELSALASVFGVSADYLLMKTDDPTPPPSEDDIPLERRVIRAAFDSGELSDLSEAELRRLEDIIRAAKKVVLEDIRKDQERG